MTEAVMPWVFGLYLCACVFAALRLLRGPAAEDRVLALDTLYVLALAVIGVLGVRSGSPVNFEGILAIALLGFVGTVAAARTLLRRGET